MNRFGYARSSSKASNNLPSHTRRWRQSQLSNPPFGSTSLEHLLCYCSLLMYCRPSSFPPLLRKHHVSLPYCTCFYDCLLLLIVETFPSSLVLLMFIWLCCQQASPPPHTALTPHGSAITHTLTTSKWLRLYSLPMPLWRFLIIPIITESPLWYALRAVPVTSDFSFQPSILTSSICWELTMHLIFFLCKVSVGARSKGFPKFFEKSDSFQRRCCHFFTAQSWTSSLDKPGLFPFAPYCT